MANRFESRRGGFADQAVASRNQPKTFLDDVDRVVDWKPIEGFLRKKPRRHKDAVGNPAHPALGMFKVLLLPRWRDLSDHGKGKVYCYGYKGHLAVDTEHGFVLGGHVTAANRPACLEPMNVVGESGLEEGAPVLADKGYSSADNRCDLEKAGYFGLTMYKGARNHPQGWAEKAVNRAVARARGSVERAFGSMKKHYGLGRAR